MNKYEFLEQDLNKNMQELCNYLIDYLHIDNYDDLLKALKVIYDNIMG